MIKQMLFRGLLEEAIKQEEAAYTLYQSALHVVSEPHVIKLLKTLMAGELQHKLKLEELQQRGELAKQPVNDVIPDGVSLIQDEHLEDFSLRLLPGMSCREILSIALLKEQQAARQYSRLSERARFSLAQNLFCVLSYEETQHVAWIQKQLTTYSTESST